MLNLLGRGFFTRLQLLIMKAMLLLPLPPCWTNTNHFPKFPKFQHIAYSHWQMLRSPSLSMSPTSSKQQRSVFSIFKFFHSMTHTTPLREYRGNTLPCFAFGPAEFSGGLPSEVCLHATCSEHAHQEVWMRKEGGRILSLKYMKNTVESGY